MMKKYCRSQRKFIFLFGKSQNIKNEIQNVLKEGGVVLTRAWSAAFDYIQGID